MTKMALLRCEAVAWCLAYIAALISAPNGNVRWYVLPFALAGLGLAIAELFTQREM